MWLDGAGPGRPRLGAMLRSVRPGDVVLVRTLADFGGRGHEIVAALEAAGVSVRVVGGGEVREPSARRVGRPRTMEVSGEVAEALAALWEDRVPWTPHAEIEAAASSLTGTAGVRWWNVRDWYVRTHGKGETEC